MWLNKLQEAYEEFELTESVEPVEPKNLDYDKVDSDEQFINFNFITSKNNKVNVRFSQYPKTEYEVSFSVNESMTDIGRIDKERDPEILNGVIWVIAAVIHNTHITRLNIDTGGSNVDKKAGVYAKIINRFLGDDWKVYRDGTSFSLIHEPATSQLTESIDPKMPSQMNTASTIYNNKPYFIITFHTKQNNHVTVNVSKPDIDQRIEFDFKVNHSFEIEERERDPEILSGFLGIMENYIKKYPVIMAFCEALKEGSDDSKNRRVKLFARILPKVFLPNVWNMTVENRGILFTRI